MRIASEFTGRVQLSVFPYLLERLIHTRHEPHVGLSALSRLIRMDPALCFMAMRLDRSMGSPSLPPNPTGVDDVVSRIGMAGIDAITTQVLAEQALNETRHKQGVALGWLWRHCLTTALLARGIAMALKFRPAEEAYIAGLLHDIGKLALVTRTPAACAPMLTDSVQANPLLEAEAQVAGSGHDRIGALLLRQHTGAWFAGDAARYHTATAARITNALPLVQMVWAANRLARDPRPSPNSYRTVAGLLNLAPRKLNRLAREAEEQTLAVANKLCVFNELPEKSRADDDAHRVPLSQEIKTRTVLSGVYGELLTAAERSAIIRVLRQSLSVFLGIETLIMLAHEPESNFLIGCFATETGDPEPISRLRIPLTASDCLPAVCLAGNKPVNSFSRSRQAELTIIDRQLMAYMQKDGILCLPVRPGTNKDGCLLLGVDANEWPWVEQHTTLLTAITAAVAGALEREQRLNTGRDSQTAARSASSMSKTRKIIHEINNPLSIIKNYLKVLTLRTDEKLSGKDELRIIDEEISRVTGLIRSLTSPSENIPSHLETLDVNATITDILGLFRKSLPGGTAISLDQDLDTHIPKIASDRNRLKQALINLLKNAMEAMPYGGTIHVSTRMLKVLPRQTGSKGGANHIQISVCDNGPGIDEGIRNELFRPNVTSKTGHDGLGLAIVQEAVTNLNGSLLFESTTGRGTCFHIELPTGENQSENGTKPESAT